MAYSDRVARFRYVTVIYLNEEEKADLYSAIKKLRDKVILDDKTKKTIDSVMEYVWRNSFITSAQLGIIQKYSKSLANELFFVSGLEPWLIDNERKMEKYSKYIATRERRKKEREDAE